MMERYFLTLIVTIEEETAIRQLYSDNSWSFSKYEIKGEDRFSIFGKHVHPEGASQRSSSEVISDIGVAIDELLGPSDTGHETPASVGDTGPTITCSEDDSDTSDLFKYNAEQQSCQMRMNEQTVLEINKTKSSCSEQCNDIHFDQTEDTVSNVCVNVSQESSQVHAFDKGPSSGQCRDDKLELDTEVDYEYNTHTACKTVVKSQPVEMKQYSKRFNYLQDVQDDDYQEHNNLLPRRTLRNKISITRSTKLRKMSNKPDVKLGSNGSSFKQNSKLGSFNCDECGVTFKLLGSFNNHKRDGKCMFTCEFCGKVFTSRYYYNFQVHLKYHRKERAHQCDVCGKSYIEANALKIHKRKHSNDRPYVCDLCGRCFYSSSHLIYHKKSLHSDTNEIHQCDLCGAVLSTLGNLRVHKQTVHVDDRPFICKICGKTFKTKKALEQKHARVHENVFPFRCDFNGCDKSFKTSASLTSHIRRHNNQRTHFCERCGKGFYNKKDLGLHTRVHTGEKPYSCKLCEYTCTLAGNLRKHLKTHG